MQFEEESHGLSNVKKSLVLVPLQIWPLFTQWYSIDNLCVNSADIKRQVFYRRSRVEWRTPQGQGQCTHLVTYRNWCMTSGSEWSTAQNLQQQTHHILHLKSTPPNTRPVTYHNWEVQWHWVNLNCKDQALKGSKESITSRWQRIYANKVSHY